MTNRNKLIIGGVVVLGAFYLYDRSKKMKALAELKAQADAEAQREAFALAENNKQAINFEKLRDNTPRKVLGTNLNTFTEIV